MRNASPQQAEHLVFGLPRSALLKLPPAVEPCSCLTRIDINTYTGLESDPGDTILDLACDGRGSVSECRAIVI